VVGDRLRFSLEVARNSAHGNGSVTVNVNDSDSFVDISLDIARRRIFFIT
jgi:hypothetical protein